MAPLKLHALRLLPDSLFGRLALLLVLALTLMFELRPPPPPDFSGHRPGGPPVMFHVGLLLDIAVRLAALIGAAWVGARWLSEPIRRLTGAARELGRDIHRAPLSEEGTSECRDATRVFNQMQTRLREQLAQRDQFVAAVSHDLRTPLTRLALRAEALQSGLDRQAFARDIQEMDEMIRATLDYLRGAADPESWVPMDIGSLVSSMACDCQDSGQDVQVLGPISLAPLRVQASSMCRCIGNLLSNALRYGVRALCVWPTTRGVAC